MATETKHILHHSPMTRTEHNMLWALLAVLALAVIGYVAYYAYEDRTMNTEYETSTVMGSAERAPVDTRTVTR